MQTVKLTLFFLIMLIAWEGNAEEISGVLATEKEQANIFLQNNQWKELLRHTKQWTKQQPLEKEAWRYLGLAFQAHNKHAEAIQAFARAWEISSEDISLQIAIGDIQTQLKNWAAAETAYRLVLQVRKKSALTWNKLATALAADQQRSSRRSLAEALKKTLSFGEYINSVDHWRLYASVLYDIGDNEGAYDAYKHVVRLQPGDVVVWEQMFFLANDIGKQDIAENSIIPRILEIDKNNPLAHAHLGQKALADNRIKIAKLHFDEAIKGDQRHPRPIAIALTGLGDMLDVSRRQEAIDKYKKAVHTDPTYFPAWERVVVFLRDRNQFTQANKVFNNMRNAQRLSDKKQLIPKELLP